MDEWFADVIQPLLRGNSFMVRYADDFVMGFENGEDARRVMAVLAKRFKKFGLELHPEKTKIIKLGVKRGEDGRSFDFLGFTHYLSPSLKGKPILRRKTSSIKFRLAMAKMEDWIKRHRHEKLKRLICSLNVKLKGHYNYYGITFNHRGIVRFHWQVTGVLFKWLNRRGGKRYWKWERFLQLVHVWFPLVKPKVKSYL